MRSMESNNPVFARSESLRTASQGVGFSAPAPTADDVAAIYGTPQRLTMDDVIVKTGILLAIVVGVGAASWFLQVPIGVALLAGLVGFVLAIVNIFKKQVSPALTMAYATAQGVFLGVISASYNGTYRGIVVQAIVGTAAVFGAVLLGYKSGKLRATPKFTKVVTFGLVGMVAVLLLNLIAGAFTGGDPLGISGGNTGLSILFTLGLITFGALTFVLDFDEADRMIAAGVAERESWRVAFGLVSLLTFGGFARTGAGEEIIWEGTFDGRFEDRAHAIGVLERHNEEVIRRVPPERLLVYEVKEGWGPLCEFLGVTEPDEPFPRLNDAAEMRRGIRTLRAISAAVPAVASLLAATLLLSFLGRSRVQTSS